MNGDQNSSRDFVEALAQSPLFRKFEKSFAEATGLPMALVPAESCHLTFHGHCKENGFCAVLSASRRASAVCLNVQEKITAHATQAARTMTCPAGLCETAVPVRMGATLIGFLRTGQVFQSPPSPNQLRRLKQLSERWQLPLRGDELQAVYLKTPVLARKQYRAVLGLLDIFAQHLGVLSNQLLLQRAGSNTEAPIVARTRDLVERHFTEPISFKEAAAASGLSPFYFCKSFKRATGLTFTTFVGRRRVEKAKNLLLNPNSRVTEICYAVGFKSLTHFNRRFKEYVGGIAHPLSPAPAAHPPASHGQHVPRGLSARKSLFQRPIRVKL